ncbi:Lipopolysaccharide export system ATP-binding protein LptB [bacterium HR40]|nr:Lipopolysaccharide export system ATP-binding protein LptB [bacterium HR40]
MSLLEVQHLAKSFGGVRALDGVSFSLDAGRVHALIGPNGAGKTTLFNLITGMLAPTSGRIFFRGQEVTGLPPEALAALGIARTFQNLQVFLDMTVRENVLVGCHLRLERRLHACLLRTPSLRRAEREARERADRLLRELGLDRYAEARADSLPYGALKRLEIARALAAEPVLLLLDEPAAGCNERETAEIGELLRSVARGGPTVLLVEHDMRLVMNLAEHILVLDHGRLLAEGPPERIRRDPQVIEAYLGRHGQVTDGVAQG